MAIDTDKLDADELLHLAIEAANRDDHARAITYLKSIQADHSSSPNYAGALFFLGSEYAQIGMYDRGVEEMMRSLEVNPDFHIARFQLGLLHLTSGRAQQAREVWAALALIGDAHPEAYLKLFWEGLEALIDDDFEKCRALLERGKAANQINLPLNTDMQQVIDSLPSTESTTPPDQPAATPAGTEPAAQNADHLFLSAYRNK